jgi:hypothetical protein
MQTKKKKGERENQRVDDFALHVHVEIKKKQGGEREQGQEGGEDVAMVFYVCVCVRV